MKWIKRILVAFVLGFCLIGTLKFIGLDTSSKPSLAKEQHETTIAKGQTETKKDDDEFIWNKIASYYMNGAVCEDTSNKVKQKDWIYKVHAAKITKKRDPKWDFVPDWDEYEYDEEENLINDYSYVAVDLTIQCERDMSLEHHGELYLNSMWLGIFSPVGEEIGGGEMRTAALEKKEEKNYFFYDLKEGETLDTTVVFMIEDKFLSKDNYYILAIINGGVIQSLKDFALVKLPLGVEKNATNSKN